MNASCREFRDLLEEKLTGRPSSRGLLELSWHAHLLACDACRGLLESEEALDALLASLPEPRLPAHLVERVVARLRETGSEDSRLDRLLDMDEIDLAPPLFARDVLARLKGERRLDQVLDTYAVVVPADLDERVLDRLDVARRGAAAPPARLRVFRRTWVLALAASLLFFVAAWAVWPGAARDVQDVGIAGGPTGKGGPRGGMASGSVDEPDLELLSNLDVLEQWELVTSGDIDMQLSALGAADEALLEDADPTSMPIPERASDTPPPPSVTPPSKG